ncbi:GPALPP motifs-containing protein 1 isoform X1 [Lethenteron reissneri]|uniref:GPALPP motifs-containing protein 1 isoform X1 n=1 Tax=Lethenteron reissneri TaxID=7753 RepID=UPI002AB63EBC|nr:GPALPP motifs-containing protein 1 isoform X1 [Lethenteron reissneri]
MSRRRGGDEKGSKIPSRFRVERGDGDTSRASSFGPALPPAFRPQQKVEDEEEEEEEIGPVLPPGFRRQKEDEDDDDDEEEEEGGIGPALAPGFSGQSGTASGSGRSPVRKNTDDDDDGYFGPALPPGFAPRASIIGPTIPPGVTEQDDSDSDGEIIGPMPAEGPIQSRVAEEIELRSQRMKDKLLGKTDEGPVVRESWMMELPDDAKTFGLGPRSFRRKAAPDAGDRSVWTDTPADRERRAREGDSDKAGGSGKKKRKHKVESEPSEQDLQLADAVAAYNEANRGVSLMDQHKRKRKSGGAATGPPPPRRPFDRDVDLQGGRVDGRKRQDIIDKSRLLGSRFSHGNSRMFL